MSESRDGAGFDRLIKVVEGLQREIRFDSYLATEPMAAIGSSESRTCRMVVAPLLSALGWDATGEVIPEYAVGGGRADYALLRSPKQIAQPLAFIEVKRMNDPLTDKHFEQVMRYAEDRKSVSYAVLTNGDEWELYRVYEGKPQSRVFAISIRRQPARKCAKALQALSRPVMTDEHSGRRSLIKGMAMQLMTLVQGRSSRRYSRRSRW